jgi:proteasome lid subunit RPN8/RPN11
MSYPVDVEDDIWPDEDEQSTDTLDLAWLTYEMIIINLPLVHSHPDGECNPDMQPLLHAYGVDAKNSDD